MSFFYPDDGLYDLYEYDDEPEDEELSELEQLLDNDPALWDDSDCWM